MDHLRSIAVVTGSRAEYGLLRPVMRAIEDSSNLQLHPIACGEHSAVLANTSSEVRESFSDTHILDDRDELGELQELIRSEFGDLALSLDLTGVRDQLGIGARIGIEMISLSQHFTNWPVDVVLVLGDRIEAFAAAAAASIAGIRVAHMHGGDRAEGIADESLRHAITKLAHIHLPATTISAQRIIAMGEHSDRVHVVGSPAIDGLNLLKPISDKDYRTLGEPRLVVLMHPLGRDEEVEFRNASQIIDVAREFGPILLLHPNHDPGRDGIMRAIGASGCEHRAHLPREAFIGLLKRVGILIGNSSAGLIECAALGIHTINIGNRQRGRERAANVVDVREADTNTLREAVKSALQSPRPKPSDQFGDGHTGPRTAKLLATFDEAKHSLAKCNSY